MKTKALVLYPKYGLANRLRSLASAKILADYTGRKLFVNWAPSKECNIEWEELFINKLERYPSPLSSFESGVDLYDDATNADAFYRDMPRSLISDGSDVVAVHTCLNFRLSEMAAEAYERAKSIFYRSLQPVARIEKTVNEIHGRYFEGNNIVGVHIRRRDHFAFNRKDPALVCPTAVFIHEMTEILKTRPGTRFFLATDDKNEETRVRETFMNAVIVYEKEVVSRDTRKGMQDALIDWLLLSKTCGIIGSYSSSFSEEAAIVNMIRIHSVLRQEELSRPHYKTILKAHLKTHLSVLKRDGLCKYFLYSYNYRKGQISYWIRKKISTHR